jgi:mRNA-degrading endonuclease RelE of RelBE toxin-antitoxin system
MASYKVASKPSVEKELRSLPKSIILRVIKQIDKLANEPFLSQTRQIRRRRRSIEFGWETIALFTEWIAMLSW